MTDYVTAYHTARSDFNRTRSAWNALPTPEARLASGIDVTGSRQAMETAARALIGDAAGRHKIEETVKVYLVLGPSGRWEIDGGSDCGIAGEGYDNGPSADGCDPDDFDDHDDSECAALADAASMVEPPSVRELIDMLTEQAALAAR